MKTIKCYRELSRLETFKERYEYLKLVGEVGAETFGRDRFLNQALYHSSKWAKVRREVIIRDGGYDLGIEGFEITSKLLIHHMNPITIEDIEDENELIFDPEYLITVSMETHNAIHYGDERQLPRLSSIRFPGDTKLW